MVGYACKWLRAFDVPSAWVDAEDVTQNACASVLARSEPVELRPYVFTVVRNEVRHAAQRYRTGQPYGSLHADVQLEAAGPGADACGAADLCLDLEDALDALTPQQRKAVLFTKALGLTQAETATVMKTAPGTVATHVSRAIVALRVALGALGLALVTWGTAWLWGERKNVLPAAGFEKIKDFHALQLSLSVLAFAVAVVGVASYVTTRPEQEPRTPWQPLGVRLGKSVRRLTNGPEGFVGNESED